MPPRKTPKQKVVPYPARLDVVYPRKLDRLTSFFRLIWVIPIAIVLGLLTGGGQTVTSTVNEAGEVIKQTSRSSGGMLAGLAVAVALMIIFRMRYPRWWFNFILELTRFSTRVGAYIALLTDKYPSTVDKQSVRLDLDYPNVEKDLNRWMPLVKWFLAIPHYVVIAFLAIGAVFAVIFAWFAILFTGEYPRGLFDFVVGVARWGLRVEAYMFFLITDRYPPFSLKPA
jgi:hypothetical protein